MITFHSIQWHYHSQKLSADNMIYLSQITIKPFWLELIGFQNICNFVTVINSWKKLKPYLPLMVN